MASITLSGIEQSFGHTQVLNKVDLSIKDGEFLTLVGPSGCGKSTLLRILAGLQAPSAGTVHIDDLDATRVRPSERNLAMVFQSYALYPHLTVEQNMMTPLTLRGLSSLERAPLIGRLLARPKYCAFRAAVHETAQALKIEALLDRKPGQLSGGQRQRVALGRAMVRQPIAFLMDEPLSNLDAALRVHMRAELAELHRALGITFVYVTHDQAEALTMSDRMAVMMNGSILQLDSPQAVYNDPVDIQVAEFVGSPKINLLPAHTDTSGALFCLGARLERRIGTGQGREFSLGLRPEHLGLAFTSDQEGFAGQVVHKENLGSDLYVHLSLNDGSHRLVVRAEPQDAERISIGQTAHATRAVGKAMLFAPNGRRLRLDPPPASAVLGGQPEKVVA